MRDAFLSITATCAEIELTAHIAYLCRSLKYEEVYLRATTASAALAYFTTLPLRLARSTYRRGRSVQSGPPHFAAFAQDASRGVWRSSGRMSRDA